jgi:signal peptidase II
MNDAPDAPAPGFRGPRALGLFAAVALAGGAVDLASKSYAFAHVPEPPDALVVIRGCFSLIQAQNKGAAFSILTGQMMFFISISVVALGLLGYFSYNAVRSGRGYQVILGLVAAGVVGNLYDRLTYHYVRDFLDVYVPADSSAGRWLIDHFHTSHWPTFNVADAFICVGTACLFIKFWRDEKAGRAANAPAAP